MKKINTVIAGSVLAAGVAAGLFGAGTASAAPGISYSDDSGHHVNIGDTHSDTGATALATPGNRALAVSVFAPSQASANGLNNNAFAFDGVTGVGGGNDNNAFTSYGVTYLAGGQRNTVVNAGSVVASFDGQAENQNSVSFCGTRLSAQSSHITVGSVPGGLC